MLAAVSSARAGYHGARAEVQVLESTALAGDLRGMPFAIPFNVTGSELRLVLEVPADPSGSLTATIEERDGTDAMGDDRWRELDVLGFGDGRPHDDADAQLARVLGLLPVLMAAVADAIVFDVDHGEITNALQRPL